LNLYIFFGYTTKKDETDWRSVKGNQSLAEVAEKRVIRVIKVRVWKDEI
jgi:hypothetical protein